MSHDLRSGMHCWVPYNLKLREKDYTCEWLYTSKMEYLDPFFTETMIRCKGLPENIKPERPLSSIHLLPDWADTLTKVEPTAFIFHISRCGSTLISQSLAMNEENIALSEVPFIDELLRLSDSDQWPGELDRKATLKAAFDFYGQNRNGRKKRLFVKTDCWHIYFLPLLRQLYPSTPFILLYRRPDEVIRSQQKKRGIQAVPGLVSDHILGIKTVKSADLDQHMASVIESFLLSFIKIAEEDKFSLLVNYSEGIEQLMNRICRFAGIEQSEDDLIRIRQRSHYDAKYPDQAFTEEVITDPVPAYLQKGFALYEQLEEKRRKKLLKLAAMRC